MKILFEARSIIPGKSGGIENYLYMLVNAWKNNFKNDQIYLHIAPKTINDFKNKIGSANYLVDPVYNRTYKIIKRFFIAKLLLIISIKIFPFLENYFFGIRKKWICEMDKNVDVIIYPFQREKFVHDPNKTIFVMHDFREWDHKNGNKTIIKEQTRAIKESKAIVVSWPYPYNRILQIFPSSNSKLYKIPFLYDEFDEKNTHIKWDEKKYLYYPSANALHKNHENLIKGLSLYNQLNINNQIYLICTGPIDKTRQKKIDRVIFDNKMNDFVQFLGFVDREKVFDLLKNCYAVITSSKYEAFSGAILEAFKFKKPVLASEIKPITEFLDEYSLYLTLFDPNEPSSIADAIKKLTEDYFKHLEYSKKGFEKLRHITPKYTVDKFRNIALQISNNA